MFQSLVIGMGSIIVLVLLWTLIQTQWRNVFREEYTEEDVLAGRRSCSNCGCTSSSSCERNKEE